MDNETVGVGCNDFPPEAEERTKSWRFDVEADEPIPFVLRTPDEDEHEAVTSPGTDMLAGEG
jgi:hypothetical protein